MRLNVGVLLPINAYEKRPDARIRYRRALVARRTDIGGSSQCNACECSSFPPDRYMTLTDRTGACVSIFEDVLVR